MPRWLLAMALAMVLLVGTASAQAAEVLQVRSGTLLQVGDRNRTYTVELACVAVAAGRDQAAAEWLRQELPRRTKVNLRPLGSDGGTLVARVQRLGSADAAGTSDLGSGLVAAGLANPIPDC
ncbi:MAG: nuclease [Vulcanococcus sp.]|jgi:endonuclease YncB( thermonuclease family)